MVSRPNPGMGPDSDSTANRTSRFRAQLSLAEELERAQTFTGANGAALATLQGDKLVWLGAVGQNPPKTGDRWSLAGSFANLCLGRKTRPQRCDDVEGDGRVDASFRGLRAKSLALAPVHDADKVTGILAVFSDNSRAFNGMHTAVLQTEADNLAELVQQARHAAGIQDETPPQPRAEQNPPRPVEVPAVTAAAQPPAAPQPPSQHDFEALESAFVVVPPPVAAAPPAPVAEATPPVAPAAPAAAAPAVAAPESSAVPMLGLVPASASAPLSGPAERPTLSGSMPLSATAAALAKAKPVPPLPAQVVAVEKKAPQPAVAPPLSAAEAKSRAASSPAATAPAPAPVFTPPPAPAGVSQASAPALVATPRPSTPMATPPPAPVPAAALAPPPVKFVPLAKPPEVKTPPPGSLKPVSKSADQHQPLPAAADPFAEFSPAFVRAQARAQASTAAPSRPTLPSLEAVASPEPARTGPRRLLLVAAAVVAVVAGGLWLRTRSLAARSKPTPAVTQAVAEPVAASQFTPPAPAPAGQVTATPIPASEVATAVPAAAQAASREQQKAPEKSAPAKPQPVTAVPVRPAVPGLTAPAPLDLKTPAPVATPPIARAQGPAPQTLLSVPTAASAKLPDLPKPEAPAVTVRRISTPVAAQLLHSVAPIYPSTAKALHLEGVVRVTAKVNAQGRVTDVLWVSGNSLFKDSAVSAVRQWRYQPATLDGQPIDSTLDIVLKFKPQ